MDYKDIIVDVKDHVAKLTFNRPQQNNSFTGAGKHFCTSTDMDEFMNEDKTTLMADYNSMQVREFVARYPQEVTKMLTECPNEP